MGRVDPPTRPCSLQRQSAQRPAFQIGELQSRPEPSRCTSTFHLHLPFEDAVMAGSGMTHREKVSTTVSKLSLGKASTVESMARSVKALPFREGSCSSHA